MLVIDTEITECTKIVRALSAGQSPLCGQLAEWVNIRRADPFTFVACCAQHVDLNADLYHTVPINSGASLQKAMIARIEIDREARALEVELDWLHLDNPRIAHVETNIHILRDALNILRNT